MQKVSLGDRIAYYVIAAVCVGIALGIMRVWLMISTTHSKAAWLLEAACWTWIIAFVFGAVVLHGHASGNQRLVKRFKSWADSAFGLGFIGVFVGVLMLRLFL